MDAVKHSGSFAPAAANFVEIGEGTVVFGPDEVGSLEVGAWEHQLVMVAQGNAGRIPHAIGDPSEGVLPDRAKRGVQINGGIPDTALEPFNTLLR